MKIKKGKKEREFKDFLKMITKLEPTEFFGVARILGVSLTKDINQKEKPSLEEIADFEEILNRTLDAFLNSTKKLRKEIIALLREVTNGK